MPKVLKRELYLYVEPRLLCNFLFKLNLCAVSSFFCLKKVAIVFSFNIVYKKNGFKYLMILKEYFTYFAVLHEKLVRKNY